MTARVYDSTVCTSPLGELTLAGDGEALVGLWLPGQKYFGGTPTGQLRPNDTLPLFGEVKNWLERYFSGEKPSPAELPLAPIGTPYRRAVWHALCEIPYGEIITYGALAARLGGSARSVGGAVGHNPISIIIPCHRVLGSSGCLTGYAGGLAAKEWLLTHESATWEHNRQRSK